MHFYSDSVFETLAVQESGSFEAGAMRIGRYLVLIILFVGFFIIFGNRGLLDNQCLKEKLSELRAENSRLEAVNSGLKREVVLMREDLRYIESVARNELGMVKPGNFIYRFMDTTVKKEEPAAPPSSKERAASREPPRTLPPIPPSRGRLFSLSSLSCLSGQPSCVRYTQPTARSLQPTVKKSNPPFIPLLQRGKEGDFAVGCRLIRYTLLRRCAAHRRSSSSRPAGPAALRPQSP